MKFQLARLQAGSLKSREGVKTMQMIRTLQPVAPSGGRDREASPQAPQDPLYHSYRQARCNKPGSPDFHLHARRVYHA